MRHIIKSEGVVETKREKTAGLQFLDRLFEPVKFTPKAEEFTIEFFILLKLMLGKASMWHGSIRGPLGPTNFIASSKFISTLQHLTVTILDGGKMTAITITLPDDRLRRRQNYIAG